MEDLLIEVDIIDINRRADAICAFSILVCSNAGCFVLLRSYCLGLESRLVRLKHDISLGVLIVDVEVIVV
jgi:hypothetical protein